ncbi:MULTISPECIES: hypothetical protein [unclassified Nocardia]|uniref:hypothetical protein n=1 Tax=unclassified Nocardia TaxID=2637762 RepID=UPI001CE46ADC|nr:MULTISPECIES: hypothetical protein [unclassified Nocardia]
MSLPTEWIEEIKQRVEAGLTPDSIADYFGRMVDEITLEEIAEVRDTAIAITQNNPPA